MSETKLPDILELGRRWQKAWTSNRKDADNAIGNSFGLLCDEITRLRSHAGWHEVAKILKDLLYEDSDKSELDRSVTRLRAQAFLADLERDREGDN